MFPSRQCQHKNKHDRRNSANAVFENVQYNPLSLGLLAELLILFIQWILFKLQAPELTEFFSD